MLDTNFTRLLRIRYPIVQAPIGSATTTELAAAVSNAGALGTFAMTWRPLDETRQAVQQIKSLTQRPFAVNVILAWSQERRIALALEADAKVVWTFWGDPSPHVAPVHAAGGLLLHTVGSVEEAQAAADAGVDALIAQGVEAGGHVRGTTPWRALLAAILETVPEVPVVVAGGIADANDIATALAAGASGACLGTRFVCSNEANVADIYQQRILAASSGDTVLTSIFDKGWPDAPHRVLRNSTVRMWEAAGRPASGARPGEHDQIAVGPDEVRWNGIRTSFRRAGCVATLRHSHFTRVRVRRAFTMCAQLMTSCGNLCMSSRPEMQSEAHSVVIDYVSSSLFLKERLPHSRNNPTKGSQSNRLLLTHKRI